MLRSRPDASSKFKVQEFNGNFYVSRILETSKGPKNDISGLRFQPSISSRLFLLMECRKTLPFNREWNKRFYATKAVRPIFVEEADEIVVVRAYTYYS
jgi:hypothetical protein